MRQPAAVAAATPAASSSSFMRVARGSLSTISLSNDSPAASPASAGGTQQTAPPATSGSGKKKLSWLPDFLVPPSKHSAAATAAPASSSSSSSTTPITTVAPSATAAATAPPAAVGEAHSPSSTSSSSSSSSSSFNKLLKCPPCFGARREGPLLGPKAPEDKGKKTLVLDLDETLIHSSDKPAPGTSFTVNINVQGKKQRLYVSKRPGVDNFLQRVSKFYEIVVFTASVKEYADPIINVLDAKKRGKWRLYRESCTFQPDPRGAHLYIKDLSLLGRPLKDVLIIDNNCKSFSWHPDNALEVGTWTDDPNDQELVDLTPILEDLSKVESIPKALRALDSDDSASFASVNH